MKRLLVPALAVGIAMVFASSASAGHLFDKLCHRDCGDPCKPACEPCKPACKPCCPKPACKPCCPKPACDPCDPCGGHHLGQKMKGWLHGLCHKDCCDPCAGDAAPMPESQPAKGASIYEPAPAPRLTPVPTNTTTYRSNRRIFSK